MKNDLLNQIQAELESHRALDGAARYGEDLCETWRERLESEPDRLIHRDGLLNKEALSNFRRLHIFVPDTPNYDMHALDPRNFLGGGRRGDRRHLIECFKVLEEAKYTDLLKRHPCPDVGNPSVFQYQGYRYTHRWFKHVYLTGLLKEILGKHLADDFITLDIGSSYGVFSGLVKQEWPQSHHILVDFSAQLILAYYFLGSYLPEARIAGVKEFLDQKEITRDFIRQYDFILVPIPCYDRLGRESSDLVTNFTSFGEMKRQWFEYYMESPVFKTARFFFTVNRVQSSQLYDSDITLLDYPVWDPEKRLHFRISPAFTRPNSYPRRWLFFSEKMPHDPIFEYIGRI